MIANARLHRNTWANCPSRGDGTYFAFISAPLPPSHCTDGVGFCAWIISAVIIGLGSYWFLARTLVTA